MVKAIEHHFFQCLVWIIPKSQSLCLSRNFLHRLKKDFSFEESHCLRDNLRHAASESLLPKVIRALDLAFREYNHIHLKILEELFRMLTEHHCSNILQKPVLRWAGKQIHLLQNLLKRLPHHILSQAATGLDKMITKKDKRNVIQRDFRITFLIKRNPPEQIPQFVKNFALRNDTAGTTTDIAILLSNAFGSDILRNSIRPVYPGRTPNDQHLFPINIFHASPRHIVRSNLGIVANHLLQYAINTALIYPDNRTIGDPILVGIDTNDDIATAKIVNIIRKSADAMVYRSRIPPGLELNPVGFYPLLVQQVIYVYQKRHFNSMFLTK